MNAHCRHYTDVVLVAVVALCTLENDVIHAAYLAIALLLFRRRDVLRTERQTLFRWLPLYNFAVMLLTLLYQSPFDDIWGHSLGPSLVLPSTCIPQYFYNQSCRTRQTSAPSSHLVLKFDTLTPADLLVVPLLSESI